MMAGPQLVTDIPKRKKPRSGFWDWVATFAAVGLAAFLITTFLAEPIRVDGRSMRNTLQDGELMLATKLDYLLGDPGRFDVVICHYPDEGSTRFVKRIVGIPGDTVAISGGVLYINGEPVREDYIDFKPNYFLPEETVRQGHYFVLGDNRASSMDSHIVGQLVRSQILGRVRCVLWPPGEVRGVR